MRRTQSEPKAAPATQRAPAESEAARLERENRSLQARLAGLTEEVGRNDSLLRKTQERELELLRAGSLTQLFERLIAGLRTSYQLDEVAPADFTVHTALTQLGESDPWAAQMPEPQPLDEALVEEGSAISLGRVQAMHEGKRRARARRTDAGS